MSDSANNIIIGMDGGGTGCRVAIATRVGVRLGNAKGGPANPTYQPQEALANILAAIEAARLDAGISVEALAGADAFIGLAGIRDAKIAKFVASALPVRNARVDEDRITTVTGALAGGDGAVAAIGTGSFLARSIGDDTRYIGGWGFRLGDQASGAWLGHKLLRQVVLCVEGVADHTDLTREVLAHFGGNASKVFDFSNGASPADFGGLAPSVVAAARAGDQTATTLMQAGADYMLESLAALGYRTGEALCLTGGLGPLYTEFLPPAFGENVIKPKGSALDGAMLLAAKIGPAR